MDEICWQDEEVRKLRCHWLHIATMLARQGNYLEMLNRKEAELAQVKKELAYYKARFGNVNKQ